MNSNLCDLFSLRAGERVRIEPLADGHIYALRLVPCEPPGPLVAVSNVAPNEGLPVERSVVVAAAKDEDGIWHWLGMGRGMKEFVGSILFDLDHDGEWFGMCISHPGRKDAQ